MYLLDRPWHECEDYNTILTYIDKRGKIVLQRKKIKRTHISENPIPLFSKVIQIGSKLWLFGKLCIITDIF